VLQEKEDPILSPDFPVRRGRALLRFVNRISSNQSPQGHPIWSPSTRLRTRPSMSRENAVLSSLLAVGYRHRPKSEAGEKVCRSRYHGKSLGVFSFADARRQKSRSSEHCYPMPGRRRILAICPVHALEIRITFGMPRAAAPLSLLIRRLPLLQLIAKST
jgi:hypothetical protein